MHVFYLVCSITNVLLEYSTATENYTHTENSTARWVFTNWIQPCNHTQSRQRRLPNPEVFPSPPFQPPPASRRGEAFCPDLPGHGAVLPGFELCVNGVMWGVLLSVRLPALLVTPVRCLQALGVAVGRIVRGLNPSSCGYKPEPLFSASLSNLQLRFVHRKTLSFIHMAGLHRRRPRRPACCRGPSPLG